MKILLITDAWLPQVNGVVRTFRSVIDLLERRGCRFRVISPDLFPTFPLPTYPEIRLAWWVDHKISRTVKEFRPDAIHIAAEGTLGLAARNYCTIVGIPFTTSYATRFPEYVYARFRLPESATFRFLRWFHSSSSKVMVSTETLRGELLEKGFRNLVLWTRGVDTDLFRPRTDTLLEDPGPILMYVGRVAVEKNIRAFLDLDSPGTKYVVGNGPQLEELRGLYPGVRFVGMKHGAVLGRYYASADVLVFPSRTDTFGLVILEALACGVPVAAYPVPGPLDVLGDSAAGAMDDDLGQAVRKAVTIPPSICRAHAVKFTWKKAAESFLENLCPIPR
jgi:glycosyltransferase involved in cell wall biosynthesis